MGVLPPLMQNAIRAWFRGTTFPTVVAGQLWVALHTTTPTGDTGGAEVSGGAYARVALSVSTAFADNGAGRLTNASDITFPTASADWGTVVGWSLVSAATGGVRRAMGSLQDPQVIASGKVFKIAAGEFDLDFTAV